MGKSKTSVRHKEWKKNKDQKKIDYAKLNRINEDRYMRNMSILSKIVPNLEMFQRGEISREGLDLTIIDFLESIKEHNPTIGKEFEGFFKKHVVPKIDSFKPINNVNELLPEQLDGDSVQPTVDSIVS